eukprot:Seg2405.1 transcript_id=Seg2405.1/GoldUCD/mRNA.D3Y31 product="Tolloid-like protein 2" protein_id=Seg2405.1/GoldUCD/D3Y31
MMALGNQSWKLKLFLWCFIEVFAVFVRATDFRHNIYGRYGTISSPNYPKRYPLNTTVVWVISVERSKTIQINFTDFSLEKNKKCIYDHVYLEETQLGSSTITRRYCGHSKPPSYKSSSNKVRLIFVSDPLSRVDVGFKANWRELGGSFVQPDLQPSRIPIRPSKPCLPTTITVIQPCVRPAPVAEIVTVTAKATPCICKTKTVTRTITTTKTLRTTVRVTEIASTRSYSRPVMTATVDVSKRGKEDNSVEGSNEVEETKGCDPSRPETLIDAEKVAAERDSSKSLVVSLGVVLAALFITNMFLLVLLCKRDRGYNTSSFYSLRRYFHDKRRSATNQTPDTFYSSYTRPTLRMVNGEIIVVPRGPPPQAASDVQTSILLESYKMERQAGQPDDIDEMTELPFHLIPQDQIASTLTSGVGTDENTIKSTRTEALSDSEPPEYY